MIKTRNSTANHETNEYESTDHGIRVKISLICDKACNGNSNTTSSMKLNIYIQVSAVLFVLKI